MKFLNSVRIAAVIALPIGLLGSSAASWAGEDARLASSYKSIINIRNLFPGDKTCPSGWVPVGDSGDGMDPFGADITLTEQLCANPSTGAFFGDFTIKHSTVDTYGGVFNGTFVPSGEMLEVHATWRITRGTGRFSDISGGGTGKGIGTVVDGHPGPGSVLLDGSLIKR